MSGTVKQVKIVEVGPRDGLQNEKTIISTRDKVDFIYKLADAGLKYIEATSFVSPKAVPQLADAVELVRQLQARPGVIYSALVPNMRGLERAKESGIKNIAVFTAASGAFTKKNINMTIEESIRVFTPVVEEARQSGMAVRGYVSTAFYCPYVGKIDKTEVLEVAQQLLDMGIEEISIGDTIGQATPADVRDTLEFLLKHVPREKIAMHFHNTNGLALENVRASLEFDINKYDSSAGGLGGCPYAPGASGNLSTDSLVEMLESEGIDTGVNLKKLREASSRILRVLENADDMLDGMDPFVGIGRR